MKTLDNIFEMAGNEEARCTKYGIENFLMAKYTIDITDKKMYICNNYTTDDILEI